MLVRVVALSALLARSVAQSGVFCGIIQGTCDGGTLAGEPISCATYCECDTNAAGETTNDCGFCSTSTLGGETMAAALNCQGFGDWGRAKPIHNQIECAGDVCTADDCCETPPSCTAGFDCGGGILKADATAIICTIGADGTDDSCTADDCCDEVSTWAAVDATDCPTACGTAAGGGTSGAVMCSTGDDAGCDAGTKPAAMTCAATAACPTPATPAASNATHSTPLLGLTVFAFFAFFATAGADICAG